MSAMSAPAVCVIGAGASGLACVAQLKARGLAVTCFEARSVAGGAWIYDAEPGSCEISFADGERPFVREAITQAHTPMYDALHTNLPHALMAYRSQPFASTTPLFPDRDRVLAYIQAAAQAYSDVIRASVAFFARVDQSGYDERVVRLRKPPGSDHWLVRTTRTPDADLHFDRVVIANGHYCVPSIPTIAGLSRFKGTIMHARFYRTAEPVLRLRRPGTRIVVVGNGPSGSDIGRELATALQADDTLYVSARSPSSWLSEDALGDKPWRQRIRIVPSIERVEPSEGRSSRLHLTDGTTLDDVSVIVFATGYLYSFPFAQSDDEPFISSPLIDAVSHGEGPHAAASVSNLDAAQLFYAHDPTLALPCLQWSVVPFPLAEAQARVIAAVFAGDADLPTDVRVDTSGSARTKHKLGYPAEFEYEDALLRHIGEGSPEQAVEVGPDGKLSAMPPWRHALRQSALHLRREHLGH